MDNEKKEAKTSNFKLNKTHFTFAGLIIAIIILVVAIFGTWLYTGKLTPGKQSVFAKFPLPIAVVDSRVINSSELFNRIELAKSIPHDEKLSEAELFELYVNQMIDVKKVQVLSAKKGVVATDEEIDKNYQNLVKSFPQENEGALLAELNDKYGISKNTFKNEVIRQTVLQDNLTLWFNQQENLNQSSYIKARELVKELDSGTPFEEVAKRNTEDYASKDFAGDAGFVKSENLLPEFQKSIDGLIVGDTKVVVSRYGIHVVKINGIEEQQDEDSSKSYNLQQIFIKPADFTKWFEEETKSIKVIKFI